jgi:hypothetical protein
MVGKLFRDPDPGFGQNGGMMKKESRKALKLVLLEGRRGLTVFLFMGAGRRASTRGS